MHVIIEEVIALIELRGYNIEVQESCIECINKASKIDIKLEDIESCLWTKAQRWKELSSYLEAIGSGEPGIGTLIWMIIATIKVNALDIQTRKGNYLLIDKKDKLHHIHNLIREYQKEHDIEIARSEELLEDDMHIYDTIENIIISENVVESIDVIKACPRCGSPSLKSTSVSEGGMPVGLETGDKNVCGNCGFLGTPLVFSNIEEYNIFRNTLEEKQLGNE